jgi:hypothetical protein
LTPFSTLWEVLMPLREVVTIELCDHRRRDSHLLPSSDPNLSPTERCPGGRILSDAEALRALLFDGDGVTPREGVERLERYLMGVVDDGYWLPASMLEGDKTND